MSCHTLDCSRISRINVLKSFYFFILGKTWSVLLNQKWTSIYRKTTSWMTTSPVSWHHSLFAPPRGGSLVTGQLLSVCFCLRLCCATLQTGPPSLRQPRQAAQVCGENGRVVSINVHGPPQGESVHQQVQPLWGVLVRFWADVVG